MPEETRLSIEIKNTQPVELSDLSNSLNGIAEQYKRSVAITDPGAFPDDVKLYVKEMRTGSILADLVTYAPLAFPFIENANHIIEFGKFLHVSYDFLTGKSKTKPPLEKADYINLSRIIEPIAKDNGSQINIGVVNINMPIKTLNLTSLEANAAQNAVQRELAMLQEPVTGIREKVLLYWYQARNDPKSQAGDRAIIESIYRGPVKAVFMNESIKTKMLLDADNPFTHAYIVDVAVETVRDKPALYRILDIHDKVEKPSDERPI